MTVRKVTNSLRSIQFSPFAFLHLCSSIFDYQNLLAAYTITSFPFKGELYMPFIRTSYHKEQHDDERLKACADTLMECLIAHFRVPPDDFFHAFHALEAEEFFFSPDYLGVVRSEELLILEITLGPGRSPERKRRFYEDAAQRIAERCKLRSEDILIILVETAPENWSFGCGKAQMMDSPPQWLNESKSLEGELERVSNSSAKNADESFPSGSSSIQAAAGQVYASIAPQFADHTQRILFGEVWPGPALSGRERSLITLAALITAGNVEQLPVHLQLAEQHGITDGEIAALCSHLAFYAGWPRAASALDRLKEQPNRQDR
ncbi:hypothetical protein B9G55_03545 [Saccharibacillus sp. O16]|nr:hypothetical protein B9G55_03545 [Saccharibacillus sp. O16]